MAHLERMVKNILLVYPETPSDSYWSYTHSLRIIGKKAATPPLGIVTVAAMLPEEEFALRLVDMNVTELRDADIEWADLVFISAMIAQKDSMESTLARVKTFGKTTVAGGPFSSTAYRDLDNIDTFVVGEAEGVWDAFLADLRAGSLKPAYAAPVRRNEWDDLTAFFGDAAHIAPAASYPDVNLAPLPRFDLFELGQYSTMAVQASRGCPVGCEFCDIWRRYGRKTRIKASERILAEMDELYRLGWRDSVFLVDDNFIGDKRRAREVLGELVAWQKRRGWPFAFLTEATLSLADDPEMLDLMAEAGFTSVFVGIETPAEESLKETGKHINLTGSLAERAARIQAKGIQVMSGFIIGFDADPDDIAERMSACIQELGIPQAMVGLLNALPDTDLYDRLVTDDRILGKTTGNNTHAFTMNFRPVKPEKEVVEGYKKVLDRAYPADMGEYFRRCAVLRERWPTSAGRRPQSLPLGWKLKVVAKYLWTAAASSYRFAAFRFLLKTLAVKPSFFEQAIELGIKGHHHWTITRQALEVEAMRTTLSSYLREASARAHESVASLEAAFGRLLPGRAAGGGGENGLALARSALVALDEAGSASAEIAALRVRIEEAVAEIGRYGALAREQVEREYRRLSRAARATLVDDMERFFLEMNRRCATC